MFNAYGRTVEVGLILGIAEALREEFGGDIDDHPGGPGNEAGQVNRAYRATARRILTSIVTPREDLAAILTWVLRRVAHRRLASSGLSEAVVGSLLDAEPGLGDAWLAYLALAPRTVIRDLLEPGEPDRR